MAQQKTMTLPSSMEQIPAIEEFAESLKDWAELSDNMYGNVMIALSEGVTNAIRHGNQEDPDKNVTVVAELTFEELIVRITDEGPGFDPDSIPDPLKEENLLNEGGRGVFLMKHYADDVQYSDNGSTLILHFQLD
jgi:serine/threonine-protein kinase RsbW